MSAPKRPNPSRTLDEASESAEAGQSRLEITVDGPAGETFPQTALPGPIDLPKFVGRFQVRALLGEGAFGRVYRAFDPDLHRDVALKVPLPGVLSTPQRQERFLREARAAAALHHPNICPVFEVGKEANGQPFIVMAYVPGSSLAGVLANRTEPLGVRQALGLMRKIALGVHAAHAKGVIHRDLKPGNILIDRERKEPVITDFGLARIVVDGGNNLTQQGKVLGTPSYMAPEQALGDQGEIGKPTDVYSLGIILFELLTGEVPFRGPMVQVMGMHIAAERPKPSSLRAGLDPRLDEIVLKSLEKDPDRRYQTGAEFAEALDGFLRATATNSVTASIELPPSSMNVALVVPTVAAPKDEPQAEPKSLYRRKKARGDSGLWLGLGVAAFALLVGLGVVAWFAFPKLFPKPSELARAAEPELKPTEKKPEAKPTEKEVATKPTSKPPETKATEPRSVVAKSPFPTEYLNRPVSEKYPNRAKIRDLVAKILESQQFDFNLHNSLRHEYSLNGDDRSLEISDAILRAIPMQPYIVAIFGRETPNANTLGLKSLLESMEKYKTYKFISTACRLKAAELSKSDPAKTLALIRPLIESAEPELEAYRKLAQELKWGLLEANASGKTTGVVQGVVRDELGKPLPGVHLYLTSKKRGGGYNNSTPQARTDDRGAYRIETDDPLDSSTLSVTPKYLTGLEKTWKSMPLLPGEEVTADFTLYFSKTVTIDYVFQPDGSRDFKDGVKSGTIKLERPNFGYFFEKGEAHATSVPDDLRVVSVDGKWYFSNFHANKNAGFYDAGEVALDSVKSAADNGYTTSQKACVLGHTYVVRTFEGKYAKFTVKTIERSPPPGETTVKPGKK